MSVRRSSIVLAAVGVVLIVLGVLVRFVVVPVATKLPGSTNLSVTYSGTATLLNSSALQSGDTKNVIATNVQGQRPAQHRGRHRQHAGAAQGNQHPG